MSTALPPVGDDGRIPKERYTDPAFFDAEMERLWPRVWQIACREEELPRVGDFVTYEIGDQSIVITRSAPATLAAFHNACVHRGTRLADGCGHFATGAIRCPYHGWRYGLDGRLEDVPDREDFPHLPDGLRLSPVRVESWGGFVFVNMDLDAEPLAGFLDPLPALLAPYRLHELRLRSYLTTILPANWKVVVDAFNEAYHVQGAHAQILPWTDDTSIAYEQFRTHAHYGRLRDARRRLRASARLGSAATADEGEILAALVAGLGGAFLKEERALVEDLRATPPPPGTDLLRCYQERRMALLAARGVDVSGFEPDQMTSADDVYWFPNVVGPIYPGSAILFRVRPNGRDPGSAIQDTWVLEWPAPGAAWRMPERRVVPDWRARNWGEITTQDYENIERVQRGMRSRGVGALHPNPRQEGNVLHMHRVLDRYLGVASSHVRRPRQRA